jgi:hypothetical protein
LATVDARAERWNRVCVIVARRQVDGRLLDFVVAPATSMFAVGPWLARSAALRWCGTLLFFRLRASTSLVCTTQTR